MHLTLFHITTGKFHPYICTVRQGFTSRVHAAPYVHLCSTICPPVKCRSCRTAIQQFAIINLKSIYNIKHQSIMKR